MLTHPDDASKLVRTVGEGTFYNKVEMDTRVYETQQVLEGLKEYGISHVEPTYIDQVTSSGKPYLLMVVEKLSNVDSYQDLLKSGALNVDQANEADKTIEYMLRYTAHVIKDGGYIDPEMMRLSQFVYDSSRPEGKKTVLVDVEPIGADPVDITEDSVGENGLLTYLSRTVLTLCIDAINLATGSGNKNIGSLSKAAKVVEALPGDSVATNNFKATLLRALDNLAQDSDIRKLDSDYHENWS